MADRYLRDALLQSDRWNALSLDAQNLYIRLLMIVDDFGCYDGRDNVIAQQAYYLGRHEALPLGALHECGLIMRYTNAGKQYLALTRWSEGLRGKRKFPAPPTNNDLPELKFRGKYGNIIEFKNPKGSDPVSILLDVHGRPVMPQPPEWRRVDTDWMPIDSLPQHPVQSRRASHGTPQKISPTSHVTSAPVTSTPVSSSQSQHAVTSSQSLQPVTACRDGTLSVSSKHLAVTLKATPPSSPSSSENDKKSEPTQPTISGGNGSDKVKLREGAWEGISEAQRLKWQDMFASLSIPDQLARAAAWLQANAKEREVIERDGGEELFVVRWLLREARAVPPTVHGANKHDA